jgi:hypothetical protein
MTPSCSPEAPIMTRTSRARMRPFTRICGCRLNQAPDRRNGSAPRRRISIYRNFRHPPRRTPVHSGFAAAATYSDEVLALIIASRREVVGNNLALARRISLRSGADRKRETTISQLLSLWRRVAKMRLVRRIRSCIVEHGIDRRC